MYIKEIVFNIYFLVVGFRSFCYEYFGDVVLVGGVFIDLKDLLLLFFCGVNYI